MRFLSGRPPRQRTSLWCLLLLAPFAACEGPVPAEPAAADGASTTAGARVADAQVDRELAVLRRATARYHRVEAAIADGYVQILPCLEHPTEGGLGIPYARLDRFDTTIDLSEPEILFYEPSASGKLELVGAEPVVPVALWGDEPPTLLGQVFHHNADHGLYGLHMWVWKSNPAGIFAFWNSRVSCEFELAS